MIGGYVGVGESTIKIPSFAPVNVGLEGSSGTHTIMTSYSYNARQAKIPL